MAGYSTYTDQELVALLKQGDKVAYTEIFERYKRLLHLFGFKRLGDREEVRDILQDIFISLWVNREDLHIASTLSTYLHTAVRNKVVDRIAHRQVTSRYVETFNAYQESGLNTTDHLLRHKELAAIIAREVEALPPKMRIVFEMSRNTNYTRKEIAEQLGISEETVKSRMHAALKILKVKLGSLIVLGLFLHP